MGIKPVITAITFVALGTSLPDTFASMAAAKQEQYADSAVGNVTGSNAVNVFLGLGLPWAIAATYELKYKGIEVKDPNYNINKGNPGNDGADGMWTSSGMYYVPAGSLGFGVVVFLACAVTCFSILIIRRCTVGGELGGNNPCRFITCAMMCSLWLLYIILSIL